MFIGLTWNCLSLSLQAREKAVGSLRNTSLYVLIYINKGIFRCVFRTSMELSFFVGADQREGSRLFKEHASLCVNSCK